MTTTQTDRIRDLNDGLRQHLIGGSAVITPGSPPSAGKRSTGSSKQSLCMMTSATRRGLVRSHKPMNLLGPTAAFDV